MIQSKLTAIRSALDSCIGAGRERWRRWRPRCSARGCARCRSLWQRIRSRPPKVKIRGSHYCVPHCAERALLDEIEKKDSVRKQPRVSRHRVPLGLLMLSRRQVNEQQLRSALAAQQHAGRGRIGEWLRGLGFASEQQVTSALARQWSCPVLQSAEHILSPVLSPEIPLRLLDLFQMIPFSFVEATATLHIAFAAGIDYEMLYAIEQMLDCRTEPCVVGATLLRQSLSALACSRSEGEIVFERVADETELVRIVSSYVTRVSAKEVRLHLCREYNWVRLDCGLGRAYNLLLRTPPDPLSGLKRSPCATTAST